MTADHTGLGRACGTFGELVQGILPDDREFLVTFPINTGTTVRFRRTPGVPEIHVRPAHKVKARTLARATLDALGIQDGGVLEIFSDLPEGKGLASSSADLVATARAVAAAVGAPLDESTTEDLMRAVEPSDGVMYDGVVAFYHREVRLHSHLGALPPIAVIAHDEGGQVDTVQHNRHAKPFDHADKREYARLLAEIGEAIAVGDLRAVGRIATRSAEMHAKLRVRPGFATLRRACEEVDGLGLALAHSGTVLGIMLAADDPELAGKERRVRETCAQLGGEITLYHSSPVADRLEIRG
ncbi:GHMP family kinase ATP-binding protein [Kitasatospora sp. NBC_01266]|uniref:GHMP family kinase ATP-binding protein n=1 Tax=Kitasatospora sp. NBC_01266 TaxID=2903572 RepID=UPI002E320817|nr:kinase [Kitasatospora sp. NBC_01266]